MWQDPALVRILHRYEDSRYLDEHSASSSTLSMAVEDTSLLPRSYTATFSLQRRTFPQQRANLERAVRGYDADFMAWMKEATAFWIAATPMRNGMLAFTAQFPSDEMRELWLERARDRRLFIWQHYESCHVSITLARWPYIPSVDPNFLTTDDIEKGIHRILRRVEGV